MHIIVLPPRAKVFNNEMHWKQDDESKPLQHITYNLFLIKQYFINKIKQLKLQDNSNFS